MVENSPTAVSSLFHGSRPSGRGGHWCPLRPGHSVGTHLIVERAGRANIDPQDEARAAVSGTRMLDGRREMRRPSSMPVDVANWIISEIPPYFAAHQLFSQGKFF